MKKNLLKLGALALGMFAFGMFLNGTSNAQVTKNGQVSLTINSGLSECLYGTSLDLGAQSVKFNEAYEFSGNFTEDFSCVDYRWNSYGATGGWVFSVELSGDLTNGLWSSITWWNVSINHTAGVLTGDSACAGGDSTGTTRTPINTAYELIERAHGTDGVCSVAIDTVSLKVNVNANQAPGSYVGTLVLTVPSF